MNVLRHNYVTLLLTVVVLAATGLNSFTTKSNCELFLAGVDYNTNEMARNKMVADLQIVQAIKDQQLAKLAAVIESEAARADRAESAFNDLAGRFVEMRRHLNAANVEAYSLNELLKVAAGHITECHRLLKENCIEAPNMPECLTKPLPPVPEQPVDSEANSDKSA